MTVWTLLFAMAPTAEACSPMEASLDFFAHAARSRTSASGSSCLTLSSDSCCTTCWVREAANSKASAFTRRSDAQKAVGFRAARMAATACTLRCTVKNGIYDACWAHMFAAKPVISLALAA
jgi:hypothetical protein